MIVRPAVFAILLFSSAAIIGYGQADRPPEPKQSDDKNQLELDKNAKQAASSNSKSSGTGGLVAFVDPVTGKIRQPDPSEIGDLLGTRLSGSQTAPNAPVFIQGPGNAIGLKLGDESLSYMVAKKTPDGKVVVECVTGDQNATARVHSTDLHTSEDPARVQPPSQR